MLVRILSTLMKSTFVFFLFLELCSRLLFRVPEIEGFNRIDFTKTFVFGGLPQQERSTDHAKPSPLRNVQLSWASDPDHSEHILSLNLYGFRGKTFPIASPPGVRRGLMIGDSFTEGFGSDDQETIPLLLEKQLQGTSPTEVINLGIGANGLPDYLKLSSLAVPLLKPNFVVLALCFNDLPVPPFEPQFTETERSLLFLSPWKPRFLQVAQDLRQGISPTFFFPRGPYPFFRAVPDPSNPLSSATETGSIAPQVFQAMKLGRFNPFARNGAVPTERNLLSDVGDVETYLDALQEITSKEHAELIVTYIPFHATISDYYYPLWNSLGNHFEHPTLTTLEFTRQERILHRILSEKHIPFVDVRESLKGEEALGHHLYLGYDEHMNAQGNMVVATSLSTAIEKTPAT